MKGVPDNRLEAVMAMATPPTPGCPFCAQNGKVTIVAEHLFGYLVAPLTPPIEGSYLIVPFLHITSPLDLPGRWWETVKKLLEEVPWLSEDPEASYNISLNVGGSAGQTVSHLHFWVTPREEDESAPSHGKGLATLVATINAG